MSPYFLSVGDCNLLVFRSVTIDSFGRRVAYLMLWSLVTWGQLKWTVRILARGRAQVACRAASLGTLR